MKIYFRTFGCQMNVNDTETMAGVLKESGHVIVENENDADVVIINSCAVRGKSERKAYGKLGRLKALKRKKNDLIVGFGGCVAEKERNKLLESHEELNFVFGTRNISQINDFIERAARGERFVDFSDTLNKINSTTPRYRESKHHAWVTIIYGCDKFCSYCIVPYVRGREKSRNKEDILTEVKKLADNGYKEITYLGQNVDSYGKDLDGDTSLAKLIKETLKIEGLERIWFLTSYPKDFSEELIETIVSSNRISKSIHLPIQSGSNKILKAMNRGYTKEEYLNLVRKIREKLPEASMSTDLILGFPGETEKDYLETKELLENVRYDRVNFAVYSPREGTLSAKKYEDNVPHNVKTARLNELLELQKTINREKNEKYIGKKVEIIVEGVLKDGNLYGRTITNKIVIFSGPKDLIGEKVEIEIHNISAGPLRGTLQQKNLFVHK
ncbi:MAG: tRNA (N6-isopentenyl adenosine(37)-C2)-methylthiotransferase MiaB [Kosmotoga sp.]|nr:MAG: tRNA (N6-isopentenyl adenosine(37)-C2)-methylthiotransferase MiaB [Kosmotoga sp.]